MDGISQVRLEAAIRVEVDPAEGLGSVSGRHVRWAGNGAAAAPQGMDASDEDREGNKKYDPLPGQDNHTTTVYI